jgi:hypothetical protein
LLFFCDAGELQERMVAIRLIAVVNFNMLA